jgi:pretoxin HINT domain-containing protein
MTSSELQGTRAIAGAVLALLLSVPPSAQGVDDDLIFQDGFEICRGGSDGTPCDDGLFCTTDDVCTAQSCAGAPTCDDDKECTSDGCDESAASCSHTNLPSTTTCTFPGGTGHCDGAGNCTCFAAGTPVETAEGPRAIETIRPGDRVLSFDVFQGVYAWRRVRALERKRFSGELVAIRTSGGKPVRTTPEHFFWVSRSGWVSAHELVEGDVLLGPGAASVAVAGVGTIRPVAAARPEGEDVFNLVVEAPGTYFVGSPPVLVHTCTFRGFSNLSADRIPVD